MCYYVTEKTAIVGSGKGPAGWFQLSHATIYLDHPFFTALEHTLNIDFINEAAGPASRVAVELSPDSARELVTRIQKALETPGPSISTGPSATISDFGSDTTPDPAGSSAAFG
jgi:hypothetical protein